MKQIILITQLLQIKVAISSNQSSNFQNSNQGTSQFIEAKPVNQESSNANSYANVNSSSNINSSYRPSTSNGTTYSSYSTSKKKKKNEGAGFTKTVLLPFACGILGAGLVVGTCFGVPLFWSS